MNRLLAIVSGVFPVRAKELAVSCIGSVASGIEVNRKLLSPFFAFCLSKFLVDPFWGSDNHTLNVDNPADLQNFNHLKYYFQDGIIPYFDAIMAPLKGFLVFEEGNLDSAIMFNQCLDTLARYYMPFYLLGLTLTVYHR
jgi:hypothetical protein